MSATAFRGAVRRRLADRSWQLTVAAGMLGLAGLALALAGGTGGLILGVAAAAVALGAYVLGPRTLAAMRYQPAWIVLAVPIAALAAWCALWIARTAAGGYGPSPLLLLLRIGSLPLLSLLAMVIAAAAGMVLIADAVRIWLGLAPRQRAPWKHITDVEHRPGIWWRVVPGVVLVGWAAFLANSLLVRRFAGDSFLGAVAVLLIAGAVAVILGVPVAVGAYMRLDRDKAGNAHDRERQRFAAHLHDSVLQTLALVQRQAHDPVAVARLARRQEHALRAWMAGEADLVGDTLVAALRGAVASVEDDNGITVEFSAIGDRALDSRCEDLVAAAREALRNAARHAAGHPVFVFCQTASDGAVELFIRDDGPGFDPAAVPAERRGIRDAIVGRMALAGGKATIESDHGEGTEVVLRLPGRKGSR